MHPTMPLHHLVPPHVEIKANCVHPTKAVAINPQLSSQEVITPVTPLRVTVGETTHQAEAQDRLLPEMKDQVHDHRIRFPHHRLLRNRNPPP